LNGHELYTAHGPQRLKQAAAIILIEGSTTCPTSLTCNKHSYQLVHSTVWTATSSLNK